MNNYLVENLLDQYSIKRLFNIFENKNAEVRLVGGCIRDSFLGKEAKDIDVAANIKPDEITEILNEHKIPYDNFAYKYGSIIALIENQKFQITTLREDVNQMGRHTNIIFTEDWKKDAARRDFTINAMYLSSEGNFSDYFNGKQDLIENKLIFIGNIEDRIQEDFLRIFRYYRFLGVFENPVVIKGYDEILTRYCKESFNYLSNDLIRQEILKMFNTSFPLNSFFNNKNKKKKKYWVELTKKHFIKTEYDLGLSRCLNKIDFQLT
jgi:poly(A) polymerase